ncbi:MAG: hypothetical protein NVSMB33_15410 [Ktedonobacteraceae bacterium]
MSNSYTSGNNGSSSNGSSFVSRRDIRASNATGALPAINVGQSYPPGSFDFEAMLVSLHELFEHDRQVASQADATRCGVCYLHFSVSELHYLEDGFYVCTGCEKSIGRQTISMLRRQQK